MLVVLLVGGFVGMGYGGYFENNYAINNITIIEEIGGGFAGGITGGTFVNCYAVNTINGSLATLVGGFSGLGDNYDPLAVSSYWNIETSVLTTTAPNSGTILGKSTVENLASAFS